MKIAVTAMGHDLEAPMDQHFGRCAYFVFVDTDTNKIEIEANQGVTASGGAGIAAAQQVIDKGVKAIITGKVGPNAFELLSEGNIAMYQGLGGLVKEEIESFNHQKLSVIAVKGQSHQGIK